MTGPSSPTPHGLVPVVLRGMALLIALAAAAGAIINAVLLGGTPLASFMGIAISVLPWIVAGMGSAGLLFGLAAMLELNRLLILRIERLETRDESAAGSIFDAFPGASTPRSESPAAEVSTPAATPSPDSATVPVAWTEMLEMLREMRDIALLDDEQRSKKRTQIADHDISRGQMRVAQLLEDGRFPQARLLTEELRRRFPERAELTELESKIEESRRHAEAQDIAAFTKRVEELMSISAWDRAYDVARELADRHPGNQSAATLNERVSRERDLFRTEQRRRMYAEVQRYVTRRRWRDALTAAHTFVERFHDSADADTVAAQLPTLQANAEVEERQEFEAQITELAKQARYSDAHDMAKKLIAKYPMSPQAEALRQQLPRLQELATNPNAAPARVRPESAKSDPLV